MHLWQTALILLPIEFSFIYLAPWNCCPKSLDWEPLFSFHEQNLDLMLSNVGRIGLFFFFSNRILKKFSVWCSLVHMAFPETMIIKNCILFWMNICETQFYYHLFVLPSSTVFYTNTHICVKLRFLNWNAIKKRHDSNLVCFSNGYIFIYQAFSKYLPWWQTHTRVSKMNGMLGGLRWGTGKRLPA